MTLGRGRPTIVSEHVDLIFGEDAGVFDLTYSLPEGTILGMIGPSGCGKTTTVRLALGLYAPQRGHVAVFDRPPTSFGPRDRERIGYIPQQFVLYPNLSVAENAAFVAALYGMPDAQVKARLDELLAFVDLEAARHRLGRQLSGGMQRRLMLVCALMHNPSLLFADEPTAGIDPVLRARFWDYFRRLRNEGRTLFVTTQLVGEAVYCDYVAVMRKGRLLTVDTPENLRRQALGGEIIRLTLNDLSDTYKAIARLRGYPAATSIRRASDDELVVRVTVAEAATQLPDLLNYLEQTDEDWQGLTIARAEEEQIGYDEVFIKIMEREEAKGG